MKKIGPIMGYKGGRTQDYSKNCEGLAAGEFSEILGTFSTMSFFSRLINKINSYILSEREKLQVR
jgi:hypothetical protein